jgi:hypothetical protein
VSQASKVAQARKDAKRRGYGSAKKPCCSPSRARAAASLVILLSMCWTTQDLNFGYSAIEQRGDHARVESYL